MLLNTSQPWPKNAWYQAAWSHEIEDKPFARTLLNEPVVLFRDADGAVHALSYDVDHTVLRQLGAIGDGNVVDFDQLY